MNNHKDLIKKVIFAILFFPIGMMIVPFRGGVHNSKDLLRADYWIFCASLYFLGIAVNVIIYIVKRKKKSKKINSLEYNEFLKLLHSGNKTIKFRFKKLFIVLTSTENSYSYQIFQDNQVLSQCEYTTLEELLEAKIISNQKIKEVWNEFVVMD